MMELTLCLIVFSATFTSGSYLSPSSSSTGSYMSPPSSYSGGGGGYTGPATYNSYIQTVQTYNSSCRRESDCTTDRYPTYLTCVKKLCVCHSHAAYDEYEGKCRIRWPSQCVIRRSPSDVVQPCVRHAHCAYPLDRNGKELTTSVHGICQCTINFEPTSEGTCGGSPGVRGLPGLPLFLAAAVCIRYLLALR